MMQITLVTPRMSALITPVILVRVKVKVVAGRLEAFVLSMLSVVQIGCLVRIVVVIVALPLAFVFT